MTQTIKKRILEAFEGLGTASELANGFRLQASGKQTLAVYFSSNQQGNIVEIGLNPVTLASLLGIKEGAVSSWIAKQAALTGRERTQSGLRGSYPGVAFGNERELSTFLDALSKLRGQPQPVMAAETAATALDRVRIEKAAVDAGYDQPVTEEGRWLVFGSTAFSLFVGVAAKGLETFRVGVSEATVGLRLSKESGQPAVQEAGPWAVRFDAVVGYDNLHRLLQRSAAIARAIGGERLRKFLSIPKDPPDSTEARRLVTQRVGQDIFRQMLIDYWGGRCVVTGLEVAPLLRASHIKPWADCESDAERLDVYNGLLLAPHLDALFDGGWVTFLDSGDIQISGRLDADSQALLGLSGAEIISGLTEQHSVYLEWHREHCFR